VVLTKISSASIISGNNTQYLRSSTPSPKHHQLSDPRNDKCGIYLAESSIPNGGLGVFTIEFIPTGGHVGPEGLCILVNIPKDGGANQLWSHTHGCNSMFWGTENQGRQFCPGISTICNTQMHKSNMALTNLPRPSNVGLSRFKSPGAGAISYQHAQNHLASSDIPAGAEVTYDYGEWKWTENKPNLRNQSCHIGH